MPFTKLNDRQKACHDYAVKEGARDDAGALAAQYLFHQPSTSHVVVLPPGAQVHNTVFICSAKEGNFQCPAAFGHNLIGKHSSKDYSSCCFSVRDAAEKKKFIEEYQAAQAATEALKNKKTKPARKNGTKPAPKTKAKGAKKKSATKSASEKKQKKAASEKKQKKAKTPPPPPPLREPSRRHRIATKKWNYDC